MSTEFDFFENPQVSKLFDLILELGMDLSVASTRVHALEMLLIRSGQIKPGELDNFQPSTEEARRLDQIRDEYMSRLIRIITEVGPAEHPLREQWDAAIAQRGLKK
jgi:hypothetical protein